MQPYSVLKERAKEMRKNPTPEERKVWYEILANIKPKFHRQRVFEPYYIVDFCCPALKIIIELDGVQHDIDENLYYDYERDNFIRSQGYEILRIPNCFVKQDIEFVRNKIITFCEKRIKELNLEIEITEKPRVKKV